MNTFRDDTQRYRVLNLLATQLGDPQAARHYQRHAFVLLDPSHTPASEERAEHADRLQQLLEHVCERRRLSMASLFELKPEGLAAVGSLLVSLANGHDDIDEWIAMYEPGPSSR